MSPLRSAAFDWVSDNTGGKNMMQREYMRTLYRKYGNNISRIIQEYATAEIEGKVVRFSNRGKLSAEQYAKALYKDGVRRGWLFK